MTRRRFITALVALLFVSWYFDAPMPSQLSTGATLSIELDPMGRPEEVTSMGDFMQIDFEKLNAKISKASGIPVRYLERSTRDK